jgi:IS30 family transposase
MNAELQAVISKALRSGISPEAIIDALRDEATKIKELSTYLKAYQEKDKAP